MLCWWRGVHCPARTKEVPAAAHHVRLWPLALVGDEEALEMKEMLVELHFILVNYTTVQNGPEARCSCLSETQGTIR